MWECVCVCICACVCAHAETFRSQQLGDALGVGAYVHPPCLFFPSIFMMQFAQTVGALLAGVVFVLHADLESPFLERCDEAGWGDP